MSINAGNVAKAYKRTRIYRGHAEVVRIALRLRFVNKKQLADEGAKLHHNSNNWFYDKEKTYFHIRMRLHTTIFFFTRGNILAITLLFFFCFSSFRSSIRISTDEYFHFRIYQMSIRWLFLNVQGDSYYLLCNLSYSFYFPSYYSSFYYFY